MTRALVAILVLVALVPYAWAQTVTLDGNIDIAYTGSGIEVNSVKNIGDSLIFNVEATEAPSSFVVTLERSLIDAVGEGPEGDFIVLADDYNALFEETETAESRTLSIEVPIGTNEIEIVGTIVTLDVQEVQPIVEPEVIIEEPQVIETVPEPEPVVEPEESMEQMTESAQPSCGAGTTLASDGITCVLDAKPQLPPFRDLIYGAVAAFIISLFVMIIFFAIARANRS